MSRVQINFTINGTKATGLQAEAHFVNWALALEQEHNEDLIMLTSNDRCAFEAVRIFQVAAYQDYRQTHTHCLEVVNASGVQINRTYQ